MNNWKKESTELELLKKHNAEVSSSLETPFAILETPSIYGFAVRELNETNHVQTVKIGDTNRSVRVRLEEWKHDYPTLEKVFELPAFIDVIVEGPNGPHTKRYYFRDHDVHKVLKRMGYVPLVHSTSGDTFESLTGLPIRIPSAVNSSKLSQEFYVYTGGSTDPKKIAESAFKSEHVLTEGILLKVIQEITANPGILKDQKSPKRAESYRLAPAMSYSPYPYQEFAVLELIKKFYNSGVGNQRLLDSGTGSGKSNMLMWAIKAALHFEGSDVSDLGVKDLKRVFSSERLSQKKDRNIIIATSGYPDVLKEIEKAIDSHEDFRNDFAYLPSKVIKDSDGEAIEEAFSGTLVLNGVRIPPVRNIVIGVSLQDISGRSRGVDGALELKKIHKILGSRTVDILLGDEAHFGMYMGPVFREFLKTKKNAVLEMSRGGALDLDDSEDFLGEIEEAGKTIRPKFSFSPRLGTLLASATVENLIFQEIFDLEDLVIIPQSLIDAQAYKINKDFKNKEFIRERRSDGTLIKASDSPFFGKPQENYFGLDLGDNVSELFAGTGGPNSKFINPKAEQVFSSLFIGGEELEDIPKIISEEVFKKAGIGDHILVIVGTKNSADATENYLKSRLAEIEADGKRTHIANLSSNIPNQFSGGGSGTIKKFLEDNRYDRTITITVNRATTGVSTPYWDTLIMARGGNSTTHRQQAYGRVNRTWVEEVVFENSETGEEVVEKYCLKPNVFVVDCNGAVLYDFFNKRDVEQKALGDEAADNKFFSPFLKVLSMEAGVIRELSREDVNSKLDEVLAKSSVERLVKRVSRYGFAYDRTGFKIDKRSKVSFSLFSEIEDGLEVELSASGNPSVSESSEVSSAGKALEKVSETRKAEEKSKEERETDAKLIEQFINEKLLIAGVLLNAGSLGELFERLESPELEDFKANLGLDSRLDWFLERLVRDKRVNADLTRSLIALNAQVRAGGRDGLFMVLAALARVSSNEVMTPETVVDLVLDKVNFKKLSKIRDRKVRVIDTASKIGSFVRGARERLAVYDDSVADAAEFWAVPTSGATYEFLRKIYEAWGWPEEWIVWDQSLSVFHEQWAYAVALAVELESASNEKVERALLRKFDKITRDAGAIGALRSFVREGLMSGRFDAVVGNPPYQISLTGNRFNIYSRFYKSAQLISDNVSMVFPKGWQTATGGSSDGVLYPEMRKDQHLVSVDNYFENGDSPVILFEGAGTGGVSIVHWDKNNNSETVLYSEHGEYIDERDLSNPILWDEKSDSIFKKLSKKFKNFMNSEVSGGNYYTVNTNWATDSNSVGARYIHRDPTDDCYKVWIRDSDKKYKWLYVDKEIIKKPNIEKWKVVFPASGSYRVWRDARIFKPNEIFSATFLAVFFDTESQSENFLTYLKTDFYRAILTERATSQHTTRTYHEFIPDLSTITSPRTGLTGWDSDWTDADLKKLLEDVLTSDDWAYIEATAIASDPAGARSAS